MDYRTLSNVIVGSLQRALTARPAPGLPFPQAKATGKRALVVAQSSIRRKRFEVLETAAAKHDVLD